MSKFHFRLSVAAVLAVLGLAPFSEASPIATPITGVTGWNKDVVYNGSSTAGGGSVSGTPFDGSFNDYLVGPVTAAAAGNSSLGLPTGGAVTISGAGTSGSGNVGDQFQLQSYSGLNSAAWGPSVLPSAVTSVTLTLGTPASYSTLSFLWALAAAANATGTDITVTYTDTTTDVIAVSPPPNWNGSGIGTPPLTGMDYYNSSGGLTSGSIGLTEITTPTLDTTRLVQSVTFSNTGYSATPNKGAFNVLAISGVVPEPGTLALLLAPAATMLVRRRRRA